MAKPIVLVIFYSRCGSTEKLALAAAVGAVQARASIRLRRVDDVGESVECAESVGRMHKEYVVPVESDVLTADAVVFAAPAGSRPSSPEWKAFFQRLEILRSQHKLNGKIAAVVDCGDADSCRAFQEVAFTLGFRGAALPDYGGLALVDRATALGRAAGAA
jgi:multimeric flavodoxin WrbA